MRKFLLDTCVVSEMFKKEANSRVLGWLKHVDQSLLYISVMTLGEIWQGAAQTFSLEKKKKLSDWFESEVVPFFQGRIYDITFDVVKAWGQLRGEIRKKYHLDPSVTDTLIAATAHAHGLEVATRNVKDFKITQVPLFNPWEDSI